MADDRSIEMTADVAGTPEEVWAAVATGPGISSWYVPHTVEEREDGEMTATFGPDIEISGRVATWDPPRRVVFDGGEGVEGMAFEWTVQAAGGDRCLVRLVNRGFGAGDDWDDQFDAMTEGWRIFLLNLRIHLAEFRGQIATPALPTASWGVPRDVAWSALTDALRIPAAPAAGDGIDIGGGTAPPLTGTVVDTGRHRISILVERPAPGTAFLAVEGTGNPTEVSAWAYFYGPDATSIAKEATTAWGQWLAAHAPPGTPAGQGRPPGPG
jgi:uncharacterized protein YndB with AHSA1/START domain